MTDIAVTDNCKNPDSYGEICVKCNKCGRFDKEPCETSTDEPMTMVYPTIFCEDAISRKDAINAIATDYITAVRNLESLPSVQPSHKGHWFDWLQNRVALAKAEINNAIESTFCTKDEAIGLGVALNVIDKFFTI